MIWHLPFISIPWPYGNSLKQLTEEEKVQAWFICVSASGRSIRLLHFFFFLLRGSPKAVMMGSLSSYNLRSKTLWEMQDSFNYKSLICEQWLVLWDTGQKLRINKIRWLLTRWSEGEVHKCNFCNFPRMWKSSYLRWVCTQSLSLTLLPSTGPGTKWAW